MRDPNRINGILDKIKHFWNENPDHRLSQIISDAASDNGYNDPFHMEDYEIIKYIDNNDSTNNSLECKEDKICEVLSDIESYWNIYPDLRLAQIITNGAISKGYESNSEDIRNMKDKEIVSYVNEKVGS